MRWAALLLLGACGPTCEPGLLCAVMGSGELGFNGEGLAALDSRLASPTSVGVDPLGRPMVVDFSNMRLRVLTEEGLLQTVAGNGTHAYSQLGVDRLDSPLENPIDAARGPEGRLHILPLHEGRVIRVGDDGDIEACVATGVLGDSGDGGDALLAEMGYGAGLAFAEDGTLFVSDNSFSRVRRVSPDGQIDTVLGVGSAGLGAEGYGPEVAIANPERLVVDDRRGRLLVADTLNHRVLSVDLETLQVQVLAGTGARGGAADGLALSAPLDTPVGVQVTPSGAVLIADLGNDALRRVGPDGQIETVAGGLASEELSWVESPEDFALRGPAGMAWTPDGDLLVAERSGNRVLRWMGALNALD